MGFTPLDGLVMATRSGSVDPGLVLWLEEHAGMPPRELAATLENRSGLTGLAGTGDMREVLSRAAAGGARAVLGRDVYLHRLRAAVAAMAAAMGGLDMLVFTGGVGENSPEVRARAAGGLGFLGVAVDESRNNLDTARRGDDWEITAPSAAVRISSSPPARTSRSPARSARYCHRYDVPVTRIWYVTPTRRSLGPLACPHHRRAGPFSRSATSSSSRSAVAACWDCPAASWSAACLTCRMALLNLVGCRLLLLGGKGGFFDLRDG